MDGALLPHRLAPCSHQPSTIGSWNLLPDNYAIGRLTRSSYAECDVSSRSYAVGVVAEGNDAPATCGPFRRGGLGDGDTPACPASWSSRNWRSLCGSIRCITRLCGIHLIDPRQCLFDASQACIAQGSRRVLPPGPLAFPPPKLGGTAGAAISLLGRCKRNQGGMTSGTIMLRGISRVISSNTISRKRKSRSC